MIKNDLNDLATATTTISTATDDSNDKPTTGMNQQTCSARSSSNINIAQGSQSSSTTKVSESIITSQSSSSTTPVHQQQQPTESITPSSSSSSQPQQSSQQQPHHPRIQRKPVLWTDNPQRQQTSAIHRGNIIQHGPRMRITQQQAQQQQQQQPSPQQNIRGLPRPRGSGGTNIRRGINRNRRNFRF